MASPALNLRPAVDTDQAFLRALYASTRAQEMELLPWSQAEKAAFLEQQFDAQHRHYQEHYQEAEFSLVLQDGQPIGRLYLFRGPTTHNLMDLSLLPNWRGHGIGSHLLSLLVQEADTTGKSIRLYVEPDNPARRLYERFGFVITRQHPIYLEMHRTAARRLSA
ncbi:GNAT family N-acetyltransferase [Stutzerimonas stutzeri]|uniref:GNAT family N-acetyltransferase n=1 Tax=Stutzerimonas stutzeri TaxID=316 RepID=UPI0015E41AFE|nr:N-acetyltransferase [Stutzerimonas stutzeri]MBA1262352.1 GNAT family N-acetyltransferase [Stutzerimonas stutzeri]